MWWRRMGEWVYRSTEVSGQLHAPAALLPGKQPSTHWIGGWLGPRASLDDLEKRKFFTLPALELQPLVHPVASRCTDWAIPGPQNLQKI
jgi:hypothetical protein